MLALPRAILKIHQRGVQWKQGVVIHMMLYTSLLYITTQIHCTPLPLHPPVMNTHIQCTPRAVERIESPQKSAEQINQIKRDGSDFCIALVCQLLRLPLTI